nr:cytochrome-c oxidase, cbb3-type subunit II [Candidatus Karelsulcia muelleri]
MLLSFPEYLGSNRDEWFRTHNTFFRLIMFFLSLPIIFFSSIDYIQSAFLGLKNKSLNIDFSISLGILVLYFRSLYEIISNIGSGYFDSLSGLVFFLLLGKFFQLKTYKYLSFDNNYQYFIPIYTTKLINNLEKNILISNLKKGDFIIIKNEEIIPADSILIEGLAIIDNSFITGESNIKSKKLGDYIYAGAKQKGGRIKLKIVKDVDKSYLHNLWINEAFRNKKNNTKLNLISKYFTLFILIISVISGIFWYFKNVNRVFEIISSILIVACPCGLALSPSFIFGNVIHILGKKGFYIRDISSIEQIYKITSIIFDKTGTITELEKSNIKFIGPKLELNKKLKIISLLKNSNHPLCKIISNKLSNLNETELVTNFEESPGKGIKGLVNGIEIKAGKSNNYDFLRNAIAHFTDWIIAHVHIGTLGWNGFLAFGVIYWLVEKLWNTKIYSKLYANIHFFIGTLGILVYVIPMYLSAIRQSKMWKQFNEDGSLTNKNFVKSVISIIPYYKIRFIGGLFYMLGMIFMIYNIYKTIKKGYFIKNEACKSITDSKKEFEVETFHNWLEKKPITFFLLSLIVVSIGGIVEILPNMIIKSNTPTLTSVRPYTPLELEGRDLYIREGCNGCHSQMVRPFRDEVVRYREYSKAGEFVYDHPFLWGSKRTGPDLAREGGKNPSSWHFKHMYDPRSTSPGSIMPRYPWLIYRKLDKSKTLLKMKVMKKLGVPYLEKDIENAYNYLDRQAGLIEKEIYKESPEIKQQINFQKKVYGKKFFPLKEREIIAIISYLQRLGKDIQGID